MAKRNAALEALGTAPSPEPATRPKGTAVRKYARVMLYMPPSVAKAVKHIAADQGRKPHDVFIDALQNWFQSNGYTREADTLARRHSSKAV